MFYELAQLGLVVKKGWIREWWSSIRWIVAHRKTIFSERSRIQDARVIPDRLILEGGPIPFRAELATGRIEKFARQFLDTVSNGYWRIFRRLI